MITQDLSAGGCPWPAVAPALPPGARPVQQPPAAAPPAAGPARPENRPGLRLWPVGLLTYEKWMKMVVLHGFSIYYKGKMGWQLAGYVCHELGSIDRAGNKWC